MTMSYSQYVSQTSCPLCHARTEILPNPYLGVGRSVHRDVLACTQCVWATLRPERGGRPAGVDRYGNSAVSPALAEPSLKISSRTTGWLSGLFSNKHDPKR